MRLTTLIDERTADNLKIIHGAADGTTFAISRRWLDRIGRPAFDGLLKLAANADGTHFRLIDDGQLVHIELDLDVKSWNLMLKASEGANLAAILVVVDQLTKGADSDAVMKILGGLRMIEPGFVIMGLFRSGAIRDVSIGTVENGAYRMAIRVTLNSKAFGLAMESPEKFLKGLVVDAKAAARDLG
jgi:hypothetical protein